MGRRPTMSLHYKGSRGVSSRPEEQKQLADDVWNSASLETKAAELRGRYVLSCLSTGQPKPGARGLPGPLVAMVSALVLSFWAAASASGKKWLAGGLAGNRATRNANGSAPPVSLLN